MFNPLSLLSIVSSKNQTSNNPQGLDVLSSVQIMMMLDYDEQLGQIQNQIKGTLDAKKSYREEIKEIQKLLTAEPDSDGYINVNKDDFDTANTVYYYSVDPLTGKETKSENPTTAFGSMDYTDNGDGTYKVKRDVVEKFAEQLNMQLDGLNEQNELMSLSVQSTTNKRKIALETVSQLVKKEGDSLELMMRNFG